MAANGLFSAFVEVGLAIHELQNFRTRLVANGTMTLTMAMTSHHGCVSHLEES